MFDIELFDIFEFDILPFILLFDMLPFIEPLFDIFEFIGLLLDILPFIEPLFDIFPFIMLPFIEPLFDMFEFIEPLFIEPLFEFIVEFVMLVFVLFALVFDVSPQANPNAATAKSADKAKVFFIEKILLSVSKVNYLNYMTLCPSDI